MDGEIDWRLGFRAGLIALVIGMLIVVAAEYMAG